MVWPPAKQPRPATLSMHSTGFKTQSSKRRIQPNDIVLRVIRYAALTLVSSLALSRQRVRVGTPPPGLVCFAYSTINDAWCRTFMRKVCLDEALKATGRTLGYCCPSEWFSRFCWSIGDPYSSPESVYLETFWSAPRCAIPSATTYDVCNEWNWKKSVKLRQFRFVEPRHPDSETTKSAIYSYLYNTVVTEHNI